MFTVLLHTSGIGLWHKINNDLWKGEGLKPINY